MRLAIAADHAGYRMKWMLVDLLRPEGHEVLDLGSWSEEPTDYPDHANSMGVAILEGRAERGVLICGSGVGASVAANKIPGIRAGLCHDVYSTRQGVEHADMNVLVIGARVIGEELAREIVHAYTDARFSPEERHLRRLAKIHALELTHASAEPAELRHISVD